MRASRLLSILILLQMRGRVSAEALAHEMEVSVRTIYRDIDELSAAGVPVFAERGRQGGFQLMDGYHTRLTGLSPAEGQALGLVGATAVAEDLGLKAELASARLKLLASLPADTGASAERVASRFHLDPVDWYRRVQAPDWLPVLSKAVWTEHRLMLDHESWKGRVNRTVDPLGLVLKAGAWYLVAAVDRQPRTYRVSSILGVEALEEPARRPRAFDLAQYWTDWSREFEARLLTEKVRLRVTERGLSLLRVINPVMADALGAVEASGGWREAQAPVESLEIAARTVLYLGDEGEVVSPAIVRQAVMTLARASQARHEGGDGGGDAC